MYLNIDNERELWYIEETEIPYLFEGVNGETFTYVVIGQSEIKRKPR